MGGGKELIMGGIEGRGLVRYDKEEPGEEGLVSGVAVERL